MERVCRQQSINYLTKSKQVSCGIFLGQRTARLLSGAAKRHVVRWHLWLQGSLCQVRWCSRAEAPRLLPIPASQLSNRGHRASYVMATFRSDSPTSVHPGTAGRNATTSPATSSHAAGPTCITSGARVSARRTTSPVYASAAHSAMAREGRLRGTAFRNARGCVY